MKSKKKYYLIHYYNIYELQNANKVKPYERSGF